METQKTPSLPYIEFTPTAVQQISLILQNDPIAREKVLRLSISGKGCDGFDYALGFTEARDADLKVRIHGQKNLEVAMDAFSAQYLNRARIDFVQEFGESGEEREGFVITNLEQTNYKGKFWLRS